MFWPGPWLTYFTTLQGQAKSDRLKYLLQQTEIFTHFIKNGGTKEYTCVSAYAAPCPDALLTSPTTEQG